MTATDPAWRARYPRRVDRSERPTAAIRTDVAVERLWLDERSWVDVVRGFLPGHEAVYEAVTRRAAWRQGRIFRYDRWIDEPRLGAGFRPGDEPPHPVLLDVQRAVQARYRVPFGGFGLAWYRDGRDGQAFHRDRDMRWLDDTVIALLTLGERRPWLLRPRENRYAHEMAANGATHDLAPAGGDLLVMGGACQVGWEHSVPQQWRPLGGRVSVQWRWTSRRGRPVRGASYRAPRHYSR